MLFAASILGWARCQRIHRFNSFEDLFNSHPLFSNRGFFDDETRPRQTPPPTVPPSPYTPVVDPTTGNVALFIALAGCAESARKHGSCFDAHGQSWSLAMFLRVPASASLSAVRHRILMRRQSKVNQRGLQNTNLPTTHSRRMQWAIFRHTSVSCSIPLRSIQRSRNTTRL